MKKFTQIIVFCLIAVFSFACSSGSGNKPEALFELNPSEVIQWEETEIVNKAQGASEISYAVKGGEFNFVGNYDAIQFLENKSYVVEQTVKNGDGLNTYNLEVKVQKPDNYFMLDNQKFVLDEIGEIDVDGQNKEYIKLFGNADGSKYPNLLMLYALSGKNPLEGEYYYKSTGEIGTYDAVMKADFHNNKFEWTTRGNGSSQFLSIELVYEHPKDKKKNAYRITLPNYELNCGEYVFFPDYYFQSWGTKNLTVSYVGNIKQ